MKFKVTMKDRHRLRGRLMSSFTLHMQRPDFGKIMAKFIRDEIPPLMQPRISQREAYISAHMVTPIGNHVWRVM